MVTEAHFEDELLHQMLAQLLAAPLHRLGEVRSKGRVAAAEVPGVYAIYAPNNPNRPVYVGCTFTLTVRGRMRDHKNILTRSDMRGMVLRHPEFPQDPDEYLVRWHPVPGTKHPRLEFENYAIAKLDPLFNLDLPHRRSPTSRTRCQNL